MNLTVNFHPEVDEEKFTQAVSEYIKIWEEDGDRMVQSYEKYTGLQFEESCIDATVIDGMSYSHPLSLRYSLTHDQKKYVLIHELGHRILYKRVSGMGEVGTIERHKFLFLILGQIVKELYGDDFFAGAIKRECDINPEYKSAWDWTLGFSDEERQKIFKEVLNGNLSLITEQN